MSRNDIKLGTRAKPLAAPVPDGRFDSLGRVDAAPRTATSARFTRRQLVLAFVLFNVLVWSALIWVLLR
jgi:hypothetical protein